MTSNKNIAAFRREVWNYYKKNGRDNLPWRKTTDPYKILVSEMMLQQTQVARATEKYKSFIKKFPTGRANWPRQKRHFPMFSRNGTDLGIIAARNICTTRQRR